MRAVYTGSMIQPHPRLAAWNVPKQCLPVIPVIPVIPVPLFSAIPVSLIPVINMFPFPVILCVPLLN